MSCYPKKKPIGDQSTIGVTKPGNFDFAPFVSSEDSIRKMILESGFEIKLVAAEPDISPPVALNFDSRGTCGVMKLRKTAGRM
ncbi:MAG: hypothetical protein H7069_11125 [Phormidesmis sp. FL-bin-119]|nr:hypothetical protein [Pedobacter sp.]